MYCKNPKSNLARLTNRSIIQNVKWQELMTALIGYLEMVNQQSWGPPGVLGIWGEWLFILRDLGSTGYYFRGTGEQAHSFGDLGSPVKKQKKQRKSLHFV